MPKDPVEQFQINKHDLTLRQQEILKIFSHAPETSLRNLLIQMKSPPASQTVRDDLYHMKKLKLIDSKGHGRGSVWFMVEQ